MTIYTIYKAVNKTNGKVYIGFDSNWPMRQYQHKSRSKKNDSYRIYKAIRKYGWDNFEWSVIYQSKELVYTLKTMEPYFIKEYQSYELGYNMTKGGDGTPGHLRDPKISLEHSKRMKEYFSNPENRRKRGELAAKSWTLTDPNGVTYNITNLSKFCRENNLDSGNLTNVAKGIYKQYRGWTAIRR